MSKPILLDGICLLERRKEWRIAVYSTDTRMQSFLSYPLSPTKPAVQSEARDYDIQGKSLDTVPEDQGRPNRPRRPSRPSQNQPRLQHRA